MSEDFENSSLSENKKLPHESAILVLGILSICSCIMWGIPGLIMGIISLVLYKKDKTVYSSDPMVYERSFKTASAGKTCAIIGVGLSTFFIVAIFLLFMFFGWITNERSNHTKYYENDVEYLEKSIQTIEGEEIKFIEEYEHLNKDSLSNNFN